MLNGAHGAVQQARRSSRSNPRQPVFLPEHIKATTPAGTVDDRKASFQRAQHPHPTLSLRERGEKQRPSPCPLPNGEEFFERHGHEESGKYSRAVLRDQFTRRNRARGLRRRRMAFEQLESRAMMAAFDVLVFSRTTGFRHDSIDEGIAAIQALGAANDFTVTATEDPTAMNDGNLAQFEVLVFLSTTGDILNTTQQGAVERYINDGGGWVGIHSAADTEYSWPFYGGLVGAYFQSHPAIQTATIKVADQVHPASEHLPDRWVRTDEWYNFQANPRRNVHVLMTLDETTYSPGTGAMGFDHPISWVQEYQGGRSFYTALGHTAASYSEPLYRQHLLGGIEWAAGEVAGDAGATLDRNFQKVILDENTLNPMAMDIAADGRVFYVQRGGAVKMYNPQGGAVTTIGNIPVYSGSEDGLLGIALDPNFATNQWVYLFYSPPSPSEQHVSRFTLVGNQINMASEQILLRIPLQRTNSNHSAGSMDFDPQGNLYIALGDNTSPFESNGFAPIDERPGRSDWDAQKSSSNMNDLRGKILRIKPENNGTYSIPVGNLFPANGSQGRPEIYVMGNRNPFRFSVDPETGWLYWGEVGPDAGADNANRGPRGYDEFNQARAAGNFGWPYFIANNLAYREYDFATGISGPAFNPAAPVNNSPNNTGGQNLPPARPAWIWYPYGASTAFPELGSRRGGRTAMGGPVYHHDRAAPASTRKLPEYFDDTLFIYEWSRNWIKEVKVDAAGNVLKINDFLPTFVFRRPMDMKIGPDGAMYVIEWGSSFGGGNADSQLVRIDYLRDFDPPDVQAVKIGSTAWSASFKGQFPPGGMFELDDPGEIHPWINVNQVQIQFNEPVDVQQSDLALTGGAAYAFSGFAYDPVAMAATWTLTTSIPAGRVQLVLSDGVADVAGNALDGDSDGNAGDNYGRSFDVLPGDVNRNRAVTSGDVTATFNRQLTQVGDANYSIFHDVNGSGTITSSDVVAVFTRQFTSLPPTPPVAVVRSVIAGRAAHVRAAAPSAGTIERRAIVDTFFASYRVADSADRRLGKRAIEQVASAWR